jgi:Cu(I)/Ag(I) efflux system membrane protein CusA/SilA
VIKSEDTFLTGYVVFDKVEDEAEVDVVEEAQAFLEAKRESKELVIPAGVSYAFAGNYQNQLRADARLSILFPTALLVIFLLIYFQFRSVATTLIIFSGVVLAIAGGFALLWLYGEPWFLSEKPFDIDLRNLFQVGPVNLSVAVWVGFIALVGIATDNGVVLSTYLHQRFEGYRGHDIEQVRERALEAGVRRARPCLMATGTTLLALLPVITSTGRGADVMLPMALPALGGMSVALLTLFLVPVLYSIVEERKAERRRPAEQDGGPNGGGDVRGDGTS